MSGSGTKGNIVGQRDDVPSNDIENLSTGPTRITPKRALHVNLRDNSGSEIASSNPLPVSGAVTVSSLPLPTGAATEATLSALNNKVVPGNELGNVGDIDATGNRSNNLRHVFNFSGDGQIARAVLPVGGCTTGRIRGRDEYVLFDGFDEETGVVPAGVMIQIVPTGSWNAELLVQVSNDNANWSTIQTVSSGGGLQPVIRSEGSHFANPSGARYLRVNAASFDGDSLDVLICASSTSPAVIYIGNVVDTELPAAASLSDAMTNPSAPAVGSHMMAYNRVNSTWRRVTIDKDTSVLPFIDLEHHRIHAGNHFFVSIYDSDVDVAGPKYIRITTPNTGNWAHFKLKAKATAAGLWEFYENPTVNAAGTTQTNRNNHRNVATTSSVVVADDPTSTADGTKIVAWYGDEFELDEEVILKQNEDYFLKFTASADDTKLSAFVEWYDHANIG